MRAPSALPGGAGGHDTFGVLSWLIPDPLVLLIARLSFNCALPSLPRCDLGQHTLPLLTARGLLHGGGREAVEGADVAHHLHALVKGAVLVVLGERVLLRGMRRGRTNVSTFSNASDGLITS